MILLAMSAGFVVGVGISLSASALVIMKIQKKLKAATEERHVFEDGFSAAQVQIRAKDEVIAAKNSEIVKLMTQVRRMSER